MTHQPQKWSVVNVTIGNDQLELAIDFAMSLGCDAVLETPLGFQAAYVQNAVGEAAVATLKQYLREITDNRAELAVTTVTETNWNANWKEFFKPVQLGKSIWVVPEWDQSSLPISAVVIRIRPAMAFGTGTHETTQLGLEYLEKAITGGETVLDIGTGSGILGIAALKLGAAQVTGIDVDANAAENCRENLVLNDVAEQFELVITRKNPELGAKRFDLGIVNMIQSRLEKALPVYRHAIKPGGKFFITGVLQSDDASFRKFLRHFPWRISSTQTKNEWIGYQCIAE